VGLHFIFFHSAVLPRHRLIIGNKRLTAAVSRRRLVITWVWRVCDVTRTGTNSSSSSTSRRMRRREGVTTNLPSKHKKRPYRRWAAIDEGVQSIAGVLKHFPVNQSSNIPRCPLLGYKLTSPTCPLYQLPQPRFN